MDSHNLPPGDTHVWLSVAEEISDPRLCAAYRDMLSPEEIARYRRFRFARHRHSYLVSHALVRTTLSRYRSVAPRDWRFHCNAHGRPEVVNPEGARLRFNLSHTEGLIACAITTDADIGVDVESFDRQRINLDVAERFFAKSEASALRELPAGEQPRRFLELWTLKEAYIKARGLGLAIPLRKFALSLADPRGPTIEFYDDIDSEPERWELRLHRPGPPHVLGLAIRRESGQSGPIHLERTVPIP